MFRKYKVHILEGDCEVVQIKQQRVNICGVDDPDVGEQIFDRQLADAFRFADPYLYTILLSHRPERFERYAAYDCDLALTGHAHGGQWRDPFGIGGLFAPDQGFFPKYTSGIYIMNGTQMLVSRGLSRESTRLPRIFNPPELVVIDIGPK
jgi:predicted MPP superfamily phosphohydrolase